MSLGSVMGVGRVTFLLLVMWPALTACSPARPTNLTSVNKEGLRTTSLNSTNVRWETHNASLRVKLDQLSKPTGADQKHFAVGALPCHLTSVRTRRLRRRCRRVHAGRVVPPSRSALHTRGRHRPDRSVLATRGRHQRVHAVLATWGSHQTVIRFLNRRRRSGYDYADYYDGEEDSDVLDYENKESDLSILEKMNKKGKKVVVAAVLGLNILLCCLCSCGVVAWRFISQDYKARKEGCITFCDHIQCRDHAYRPVVKFFKSLDLRPPTYNEFKRMRAGYQTAGQSMAQ